VGQRRHSKSRGLYFFLWKRKLNWEQVFVCQRIVSAIKRVEFVSDTMSYMALRGRWCNIIVLNARAPNEEKSDDSKDSFYEELEQVSIIFLSTI
jgi:hypothetical protein